MRYLTTIVYALFKHNNSPFQLINFQKYTFHGRTQLDKVSSHFTSQK